MTLVDPKSTRVTRTSSNLEVQEAVDHTLQVFQGLSPPTRAILIEPLPPDPSLVPPAEATPQFLRLGRRHLQVEHSKPATVLKCRKQPARSSSRSSEPALGSPWGATAQATPQKSLIQLLSLGGVGQSLSFHQGI